MRVLLPGLTGGWNASRQVRDSGPLMSGSGAAREALGRLMTSRALLTPFHLGISPPLSAAASKAGAAGASSGDINIAIVSEDV